MQIDATWIFSATRDWLTEPNAPRVLIHRGGTRSGKTYNACIAWATYLAEHDERLSIVRKTLPALKASVLEDMIGVLDRMGLYDPGRHHQTDKKIDIPGGGEIDYFPTDDEQKVRGRARDHLWGNEANEIPRDAWQQLVLRTEGRIMLDFNPSHDAEHWIVDRYEEPLEEMDPVDARKEGGYDLADFREAWIQINGEYDPEKVVDVVEFEYVGRDRPSRGMSDGE
jgi:PBSX family phage terminase large subunit